MRRAFVSDFLLPLVRGGTVRVARPLGPWDVERMMRAHTEGPTELERDAALTLGLARRRALATLVPRMPALALGETTWRLGAAIHDLLTLSHPGIASGPGADARIARVAATATALAAMGAPTTLAEMLARHSIVARIHEVMRIDHTVRFWLGKKVFVGRRPPPRVLALPRLRAVKVDVVRRGWLRDIGIPAAARPALAALNEASPLGEALDPLRLDLAVSWGRLLSVLRFPVLTRLVARQLVDTGVDGTGDALAGALYRFGSLQDTAGPVRASPSAVAFAIAFLAHILWLAHLFEGKPTAGRAVAATAAAAAAAALRVGGLDGKAARAVTATAPSTATVAGGDDLTGRDLAVVLAAAAQTQPSLIWPADVPRDSELGRAFALHLERQFERHDVMRSPRWSAALELGRLAAQAAGNAV